MPEAAPMYLAQSHKGAKKGRPIGHRRIASVDKPWATQFAIDMKINTAKMVIVESHVVNMTAQNPSAKSAN